MGFHFILKITIILNVILFSCFLKNTESHPNNSLALLIPGSRNSTTDLEYLKSNSDESREEKSVPLHVLNNQLEEVTNKSTEYAETNASKKKQMQDPSSPMMVPYMCDIGKGKCWLKDTPGSMVTVFMPIKLLPDRQPPTEIELKELYSLVTQKSKELRQMESSDLDPSTSTEHAYKPSPDVHHRRKRDTQYAEAVNDNAHQEWPNQAENEGYQPYRVQRDITSTTEHIPTSTEGRTQRNVDPQLVKQSKRSAEMDEDEVDDKDMGSPSPEEDYQDEEDTDYQPEKRFAGPETTGETTRAGADTTTKAPTRREAAAMSQNPNFNYPYFANPGMYYPSQRLMSPFDGVGYRSADAVPMWYMNAYPGFWPGRGTRNPHRYSQYSRQAGGYGRGWPPAPPYYPPYGGRYQQSSYSAPEQQHYRGHYQHQYPKQSSRGGYSKPFSYSYAQGNGNYQTPVRKPIETDADMYYGK